MADYLNYYFDPDLGEKVYFNESASSSSVDYTDLMNQYKNWITENTKQNNAWSAEAATTAYNRQLNLQRLEQQYNAAEAGKNRDWQSYMSNTAHQREVADLKAAGLNPVLSAMGGNGASVTSGATASASAGNASQADTDQSANTAIASILGSTLSAFVNLENQRVSAETQQSIADKYNAVSQIVAQLQSQTSLSTAQMAQYASMFGANLSSMTSKELQRMQQEFQWAYAEAYPSNVYQAVSALIGSISGHNGLSGGISSAKGALSDFINDIKSSFSGSGNRSSGSRATGSGRKGKFDAYVS